jgi:hypothetical protein
LAARDQNSSFSEEIRRRVADYRAGRAYVERPNLAAGTGR